MHVSAPHLAVFSVAMGGVLAALAATTRPLSGREVVRLGGVPRTTAARVLQDLVEHGLVNIQEAGAGAALLYTLNREHLAAEPVVALMSLRRCFVQRLKEELESWSSPPLHASLFGSAASGDGNTSSDVDLLIVRPADVSIEDPKWRDQVECFSVRVFDWTGNHAGISEVDEQELGRLLLDRPPVVQELEQDSVTLVGPAFRDLSTGRIRRRSD